jgi:hypothetical protein
MLERYNRGLVTLNELAGDDAVLAVVQENKRLEKLMQEQRQMIELLEQRLDWVTDLLYDLDLVPLG